MTKAEIIDLIIIKLSGGKIVADTKIHREDVSVYLAPAVNYSLMRQYYVTKNEEGIAEFPEDFVATFYNVEVKWDDDRDLRYMVLPGTLLSLSNNRGIRNIAPMKGKRDFVPISLNDREHNDYYANSFKDFTQFWPEGTRVYFDNLPEITDKVLVRMIQSVSDLEDDDELPIPAGYEPEVIKIIEEFFTGQRSIPADMKPNNAAPKNGNV